ncbi:MAG TPA: sulfatase-like hydrolase/transferase [Lacipirellula sp.]
MRFFSLTLLALSAWAVGGVAVAAEGSKPNIVVLFADDTGWGEFGAQGNKEIPTPNIDSIAAGGVKFTDGYVTCPLCSPSRAGLITGRYQTRFGHEFNERGAADNFGLPVQQKTIADRLKTAGYATIGIGKWHLGWRQPEFRPTARGFDEYYGTMANSAFYNVRLVDTRKSPEPTPVEDDSFYTTDAYADRAVEFINEHKSEPFFIYLPFNAQHAPLQAPKKYLDRFPQLEGDRKIFAGMMSALDDAVGEVLGALEKNGLTENTLVVFLTDNGGPTKTTTSKNDPLRGSKATMLEGGIRVPFYMQWKGHLPAGEVYEKPVISLDILPTALAAAGAKPQAAEELDGVNLLPYLTGENEGAPHESLFWRFGKHWAVRHGDWKLVAANPDGLKTKLYNLAEDVGETNDLSDEHPEKVAELQKLYDQWNAENVEPKWKPGPETRKSRARRNRQQARKRAQQERVQEERAGVE